MSGIEYLRLTESLLRHKIKETGGRAGDLLALAEAEPELKKS